MGTEFSRRHVLGALGGAAVISAAGYPGASFGQSAKLPAKIIMGYLPATALVAPFAGETNFWRDAGLNVEFVRMRGGPAILQAIAAGGVPVGNNGIGPSLLGGLRGAPYYSLTLGAISTKGYPWSRLMVPQDSPIQKFSDLEGKTLGLHQRGTMEHISLGAAARAYKVPIEKIKIALIPFPHQPQVLAKKQVDAIYTVPPFDVIAEKKFGARTIMETPDFMPYIGYDTLIVHRDFAKEYPEAVKRLIKGYIQFARWIDDETDKARVAVNKTLKVPADIAADVRIPYYVRNSVPMMPNVWHLYHMFVDAKIIEPAAHVKQAIEEYFVEPAKRFTVPVLDELGWQPDPLVTKLLNTQLPLLPEANEAYFAPWDKKLARG